ncbi:MAG: hypothetical protein LBR43_04090 [Spiroplasmataceae bacterium]|nr:hypothetical protein [Spiroplasmataceae bacterium]
MKNSNENSRVKKNSSSNRWYYIFFLLLILLLIGGAVFYLWPQPSHRLPRELVVETLGEKKTNPTADQVSDFLLNVHDLEKTVKRYLNKKNRKKSIRSSEKEEMIRELQVISSEISKISSSFDFNHPDSQNLPLIYSQLYEQAILLVELKEKVFDPINHQEAKKQYSSEQLNWKISESEEEEIKEEMNRWIVRWYSKFMREELKPEKSEKILTKYIKPIINGQEINNPSPEQTAKFERIWNYEITYGDKSKENISVNLKFPLLVEFDGYGGFLSEEERNISHENSATLGVTKSPKPMLWDDGDNKFKFFSKNIISIVIKLRKEIFFNRLGYDLWINKLDESGRKTSTDISFDQLVETIAHEIAHAVVSSLHGEYLGEYDGEGGHGKIHDDFTERVEKMIRGEPEFLEFEKWWKQNDKTISEEKSSEENWPRLILIAGGLVLMISFFIYVCFLVQKNKN